MVHLPFYLQNSGLRKVKIAQQTALAHKKNVYASVSNEEGLSVTGRSVSRNLMFIIYNQPRYILVIIP